MKDSAGWLRGFLWRRVESLSRAELSCSRRENIDDITPHTHTSRAAQTKEIGHTCVKVCVVRTSLPACAPRGSFRDEVRWAAAATGGGGGAYRLHDRITVAATISQRVTGAAQSRRDAETRRAHANGSL